MTDNERRIIEAFKRYYKKSPRHSYSLLVVKDRFHDAYNFYLEETDGATYSHGLGVVAFEQLEEYKAVLRKLLDNNIKVEYRQF